MGCIYRIVCWVTGRSYVGQTVYSHPFVRFGEHQRSAKNGEPGVLYDDLRMYSIHEFECICLCVCSNEALNALECYYAEQYDAYNVNECGKAPVRKEVSDEQRMWMRKRAILRQRKN